MNVTDNQSENGSNIYEKYHTNSLWYSVKYEIAGVFGRILCNRKVPAKSRMLHLGCGYNYLDDFVNADYYYLRWLPFVKQAGKYDWLQDFRRTLNCPDEYWEGVFSEHTIEHLHYSDCLKLFKELHRTMKTGAWMRICVPGLEETLAQSCHDMTRAEQVHHLAQNYGHISVWNVDLMFKVLRDSGFTVMRQASYLSGTDERLICDSEVRSSGSLYVEAQK